MTIKIEANMTGPDILAAFAKVLNDNQITPNPDKLKILVTNSQGKEVEIASDKIRLVYNQE